ncbi:uncharacterized protein [Brachyistius frenatus]|uniref:uncharacterized protein n=1 Tax=Brachyistius frenatus TaxID=100188 RepID=UPI0037E781FF
MLCGIILLFFSCESTVKSQMTPIVYNTTAKEELSPLQLEATPNYPVAAGQSVSLHCSALTTPASVTWSWQRLKNQTWEEVGTGRELTLTEPEQSGSYRCLAEALLSPTLKSPNHNVFIISMRATVGENLGIAAFVLSLLALIISLTVLGLGWQRLGDRLTVSDTTVKGPEMQSKGDLPQTDDDGDVYINYTSTNQAYTDLDPTNVTGDNMYSDLS